MYLSVEIDPGTINIELEEAIVSLEKLISELKSDPDKFKNNPAGNIGSMKIENGSVVGVWYIKT